MISFINKRLSREVRILLGIFREHWYFVTLTCAFALLAAVFEGASIGMLIPFLRNIADTQVETFHTGWMWFDELVLKVNGTQLERLYRICAIILAASWLRAGFSFLSEYYATVARVRYVEGMRARIIDQLLAVSLRYFSKTRAGEIINSLTTEISRVIQSLQAVNVFIIRGALMLVYVALMVYVSWQLSLIILVCFGTLSMALGRFFKRIKRGGERVTSASGVFTSSLTELIGGVRTIAAYNTQDFERSRVNKAINRLAKAMIRNGYERLKVTPISQGVISSLLIIIILVATQYYVLPGKLDVALLLAFVFALVRMMPLITELNKNRGTWASLHGSLINVAELLRTDNKPYLVEGKGTVDKLKKGITFEDVSFSYDSDGEVLQDINIRIERAKTTAIVGTSGAGKSTLVDLIPRFYDPSRGRVLWDDTDLRDVNSRTLREKIAVVSQSTFIFNDTIRNNIAYGLEGVSDERVLEVAEQANALEFIADMPNGLDTILGDSGMRLSGGQRQRIAIARAILRDPDILILDEATSALDSVSEKLVQQSLERLMKGRTVIAIAHRLSTVENADWVVVLEKGRVLEQGTYSDLLEKKGKLWEFHAIQFQLAMEA
ncbi:MAG: ABC transporter ATP-binding protein [Rhodothermales bacterium]